jgi:hypothetical protein
MPRIFAASLTPIKSSFIVSSFYWFRVKNMGYSHRPTCTQYASTEPTPGRLLSVRKFRSTVLRGPSRAFSLTPSMDHADLRDERSCVHIWRISTRPAFACHVVSVAKYKNHRFPEMMPMGNTRLNLKKESLQPRGVSHVLYYRSVPSVPEIKESFCLLGAYGYDMKAKCRFLITVF